MRTGTVSYKLEDLRKGIIIPIGMVGENDFTRVIFDAEEVFKKHPDAQVTMKVQPPKGGIYPATVTRDGNTVIWQVKAADVAHRGSGELQLTFTADTMVEKSYIAKTDIKRSLVGNGPAPDPVQDWVDEAQEALEDIESAEVHQPIIGEDGYWYTWNKETGEYEKTDTKAQGADGQPGQDGAPGRDGTDATPDLITKDYADLTFPVAEGTYCYHSGLLYYAKQDIQTSEAWTAAHWQQTTVEEQQRLLLTAIQGKYTKPSGGIPASDIADGVIPVVDSALSDSSENAVQNKVVKGALDTKAPVIINTVTGNPAVFNDGYGLPIKSLLIPFTPKQSGTGDPSPYNIRPFLPLNGLSVYQSGVDTSNPTETDIVFPSPVYGGMPDVVSGVMTVKWAVIALNGTEAYWENYNQGTAFCVPIIGMTRDIHKTVFCDRFAQIKNITQFGVYASASNDYVYFINATDIEGVTDLASWKAYLAENPMEFAYELAEPYTVQLTPTQITALVGNNTIWSDADVQLTIEYPADTETFIANQHHNFIAPELSSMIADTALVKNDFRIVGNNLYKITTAIASGGTLTPNTNCVKTTLAEVIKPLLT